MRVAVAAVSVIVPARDAAATIGATLAGLEHQVLDDAFEVIVVDDGSRDDTAAIAARSRVVTRVVAGDGQGQALARNRGVAVASAPALAFTDADCVPTPAWLSAGLAALANADLVQGAVRATPGVDIGPFDRTLWVTRAWGLFEAANLFVRRDLFERLGGFESWLRPGSGEIAEDAWLGWRARRAGARTAFSDTALVHHAVLKRGPLRYVKEQLRRRHFPAMARRMPELRDEFFYRRYFLSARSAAFDAALLGAVAAAVSRRPAPLLATLPYARQLASAARGRGRRLGPQVVAAELAADALTAAVLAWSSIEARALLL